MLTLRRVGMALVAMVVVLAGLTTAPASAGPSTPPPGCTWVNSGTEEKPMWTLNCQTPGGPGDPGGGGGGGEPSCDLSVQPYTDMCEGENACMVNNPALADGAEGLIDAPRPSPDHHPAFKDCTGPDGSYYEWYWTVDEEGPTPGELAQQALALLELPTFTPTFNPPRASLVNLETWWWAQGASSGEVTSPAALGVRAIASPDHMEVDPGDGSGVMNCPVTTTESDSCTYVYRRGSYQASAEGPNGAAAFPARMRLVYNLSFELNGDPFTVGGVPGTVSTAWTDRPIPVREVQTVVVPG